MEQGALPLCRRRHTGTPLPRTGCADSTGFSRRQQFGFRPTDGTYRTFTTFSVDGTGIGYAAWLLKD
jgi:hypothetical protein